MSRKAASSGDVLSSLVVESSLEEAERVFQTDDDEAAATSAQQKDLLTTDQAILALRAEYPAASPADDDLPLGNEPSSPTNYTENKNPILAQIKVNTTFVTVHEGRLLAMPFVPRACPGDFEIAAEVVARALLLALNLRPLLQFHFEVAFSSSPAVVHSPHVAIAELTSSRPMGDGSRSSDGHNQQAEGKSSKSSSVADSLLRKNKITRERDATVRVVIRNSRTDAREATAVLVYHVDHNM